MSRSAKRTVLHLPLPQGKQGTWKTKSLLDIRFNIRELKNDLDVNIKVDKLQFFDFARYLFEMSLMQQFLISSGDEDMCAGISECHKTASLPAKHCLLESKTSPNVKKLLNG